MKFKSISIDGYGRFAKQELEISEGLQVIGGPNEQGKSTLRNYISDMLYGQKRNTSKRMYDEANEVRKPWMVDTPYGGRLTYVLDDGTQIEVHRVFDKNKESIQVFDRTHGEDITNSFPILKNRESTFAESHLGITKSVYLGMATISHLSLSGLGDKEALASIREKLLSLADSGGDKSSAEHAIKWLAEWQAAIGSKNARTKPLAKTRARLEELETEYRDAVDIRQEVSVIERQRNQIREEIGALLNKRNGLEREIENIELAAVQDTLAKAETLHVRLEELTSHCTELGSAREFSLDHHDEMVHVQTLVEHARGQVNESRERYSSVQKDLDAEKNRLKQEGIPVMTDPDPAMMSRLSDLEGTIKHGRERWDLVTEWRSQSEVRYMEAQSELSALPDFTKIAGDPIDWISQQIDVFEQCRKERDTARHEQTMLEDRIASMNEDVQPLREWFDGFDDFESAMAEYENQLLEREEEAKQRLQEEMNLRHSVEDGKSRLPVIAFFSFGSVILAIVFVLAATLTQNDGLYIPATIMSVLAVVLGANWMFTRRNFSKAHDTLHGLDEDESWVDDTEEEHTIRSLLKTAGCSTSRELEGLSRAIRSEAEAHRSTERTIGNVFGGDSDVGRSAQYLVHRAAGCVSGNGRDRAIGRRLERRGDEGDGAVPGIPGRQTAKPGKPGRHEAP